MTQDNGITHKASNRGFAAMDEEKQREIASKGGQSQGKGNNPGNFANNPQRAAEAGRKGGQARGNNQEMNSLTDTRTGDHLQG